MNALSIQLVISEGENPNIINLNTFNEKIEHISYSLYSTNELTFNIDTSKNVDNILTILSTNRYYTNISCLTSYDNYFKLYSINRLNVDGSIYKIKMVDICYVLKDTYLQTNDTYYNVDYSEEAYAAFLDIISNRIPSIQFFYFPPMPYEQFSINIGQDLLSLLIEFSHKTKSVFSSTRVYLNYDEIFFIYITRGSENDYETLDINKELVQIVSESNSDNKENVLLGRAMCRCTNATNGNYIEVNDANYFPTTKIVSKNNQTLEYAKLLCDTAIKDSQVIKNDITVSINSYNYNFNITDYRAKKINIIGTNYNNFSIKKITIENHIIKLSCSEI